MKRNLWLISLLVCLLLLCAAGCEKGEAQQGASSEEKTVTVIGEQGEQADLAEGEFHSVGANGSISSDAKELGGSKTLSIEYSDEETQPDDGDTTATEPLWQPGIW